MIMQGNLGNSIIEKACHWVIASKWAAAIL